MWRSVLVSEDTLVSNTATDCPHGTYSVGRLMNEMITRIIGFKCLVLWRPNKWVCRLFWGCEGNSRISSFGELLISLGMCLCTLAFLKMTEKKTRHIPGQGFWESSFLLEGYGEVQSVFSSDSFISTAPPFHLDKNQLLWNPSSFFSSTFPSSL